MDLRAVALDARTFTLQNLDEWPQAELALIAGHPIGKMLELSYEEAIDAWRTSCPRLPVWEDANDRGLIARDYIDGQFLIRVTPSGRALLSRRT